jgi:phage recombination protein Bet
MSTATLAVATQQPTRAPSLLGKIAERYSVDPSKMMTTLKATAFKVKDATVSDEQMMALLIVADQYKLNPFTREIFAFPDKGGIVPVVSVDGWSRIVNEHPQFDGLGFTFADDGSACTCTIYRKDRSHPISVTEYMAECKRGTQPWQSHPRRMLRHKSLIQCARLAFGFAGIYDPDEAERMTQHMGAVDEVGAVQKAQQLTDTLGKRTKAPGGKVDQDTGEIVDVQAKPASLLPDYLEKLKAATGEEAAGLLLDEARDVLSAEDVAALAAAFDAQFGGK